MNMQLRSTPITGLMIASNTAFKDDRGAFRRLFCDDTLQSAVLGRSIVQINHSMTRMPGAVRGLHFQRPPAAEMKMVRCLKGRVWDVAVDLRHGSNTYLKWFGLELSAELGELFLIPEGFAHGFQVLEPNSELLYLHTAAYSPSHEAGLRHDDPTLKINWPLPVQDLSQRDHHHPLIDSHFQSIVL
jgi:dTDP-4-dehydrorhamnose 3,5-epimerase